MTMATAAGYAVILVFPKPLEDMVFTLPSKDTAKWVAARINDAIEAAVAEERKRCVGFLAAERESLAEGGPGCSGGVALMIALIRLIGGDG